MAKSFITNPVFHSDRDMKPGFNLISQAHPFNTIFDIQPLDEKTTHAIDQLMLDAARPETVDEETMRGDLAQLKTINLEIKTI